MRVAGRGIDGTAKPIRTDNSGNVGTVYSGGLSGTHIKNRIGELPGGNHTEEFLVVQKESIIHSIHFMFDREDRRIFAYFDLWNGQNLADGSHFRRYNFLTSPSTQTGAIRPGNLENNQLFIENGLNVYLQQPLHVKGFRIHLINNTNEAVNLACQVVWSEV